MLDGQRQWLIWKSIAMDIGCPVLLFKWFFKLLMHLDIPYLIFFASPAEIQFQFNFESNRSLLNFDRNFQVFYKLSSIRLLAFFNWKRWFTINRWKFLRHSKCWKVCAIQKQEWKLKNEKFCYLYSIGRVSFRVISVPIFNNDKPLSCWSYFPLVYFGLDVIMCLYTIVYYILHGNLTQYLPSTCMMVGPAILVSVHHQYIRLIATTWKCISICAEYIIGLQDAVEIRFMIQSLVDFAGHYIYPDNDDDPGYTKICSQHMEESMKRWMAKMGDTFWQHRWSRRNSLCIFFKWHINYNHRSQNSVHRRKIQRRVFGKYYLWVRNLFKCHSSILWDRNNDGDLYQRRHDRSKIGTLQDAETDWRLRNGTNQRRPSGCSISTNCTPLRGIWEVSPEHALSSSCVISNNINESLKFANRYTKCIADILYWRSLISPPWPFHSIGMCIYCQFSVIVFE